MSPVYLSELDPQTLAKVREQIGETDSGTTALAVIGRPSKGGKPWQEYCDSANWHEAASIFPLMPDDELQKLADDIKAHGLRNPIVLLNDKVLDGRNRVLACRLAGVRPDLQPRNPEKLGSPVAWVLSQNLHRRQLTTTQRAFIAVEAEKLLAVEAKQRRETGNNQYRVQANLPEASKGQARDFAAKACDVSPRYVQDAKAVAKKSPEIAAQAKTGQLSMSEAKAAVQAPTPERIEPSATLRIVSATIKEYYESSLGNMHPHGKEFGGLNGQGIVYAAKTGTDIVGWAILQQYSNRQCIRRLLARDWDLSIGQALLRHVLKNHTRVYALLDDSDSPKYLAMYAGLMQEVSRKFVAVPEIFADLPDTFNWEKQSCIKYLREHPDIHKRLFENAEALGIRLRPGGVEDSVEIVQKKLASDVVFAGEKFWRLRPRTLMRYKPLPSLHLVEPESPAERHQVQAPAAEVVAALQAHEKAARNLQNLLKANGIDADVSRSKSDGKFHVIWHDATEEQVCKFAETFKSALVTSLENIG